MKDTKAWVREPSEESVWNGWDEVALCDLEGNEVDVLSFPLRKEVRLVGVDEHLGLAVLTEYGDTYFTCPSIDLEMEEE